MSTWAVRNDQDRKQVIRVLERRATPCTVEITKGAPRSTEQNRLQRLWMKEAEEQGDMTAEEYRGYCKLHFGVSIMKSQSDLFAEKYDRIIKPLCYEQKLELMMLPLDFPVTRLMNSASKKRYLDAVYLHFTDMGFRLTDPKDLGL